jgi:translation initiation factor 1
MERRRGKPVTVVAAEGLGGAELQALGRELRSLCGTGGTVKDGAVELQGEHRDRLRPVLGGRGYRVKG